jgi:hypothetical protein
VRGHEDRAAGALERAEVRVEPLARVRVEARVRLVEEQDGWAGEDQAREREPALHAE